MIEQLIGYLLGFIFIAFLIFYGLGICIIKENQVGVITKKFGFKSLESGRIIATQGEAGVQAETLSPGWHFWFWPIQYKISKVPVTMIEPGILGLVVAQDGMAIPNSRLLGKSVPCNNFQNATQFLQSGGEKGKQLAILTPGTYRINTSLFDVMLAPVSEIKPDMVGIVTTLDGQPLGPGEIAGPVIADHDSYQNAQSFLEHGGKRGLQEQVVLSGQWNFNPWFLQVNPVQMTIIPIGSVGVVTSYVGKPPIDISGDSFKHGNLVEQGHKGVWSEPLYPGSHPINTSIMKIDSIPTTNIVLNWATGRNESHKLDCHLSSITVRSKDGFSYNLDVSVVIHIGAKDAARVISRTGSMLGLISQVLEPTIGNYFRNAAQDYAALDFLSKRTEMQKSASKYVAEALKNYDVEAVDTLIGDIVLPAQLLDTQIQKKLAEEMKKTYEMQEQSQRQKEALNRQTALTEMQTTIVTKEQGVKLSQLEADQKVKAAEGETKVAEQKSAQIVKLAEADSQAAKLKAEGAAAEIEKRGIAEATGILAKGKAQAEAYKLGVAAMGDRNFTLVQAMDIVGREKVRIIPEIMMGSNNESDSQGGLVNLLLYQMFKEKEVKHTQG